MLTKLKSVYLRSIGPNAEHALVNFAQQNSGLLAVSLAFSILAYGYSLTSFSLSLDEELQVPFARLGIWNNWHVEIYRWGISIFNFAVIGGSKLPFLRPFLALCLLSVAATVYAGILPIKREARYFFCLIFATVPTFAYALSFSFQSIEFALSFLLFVLGLKCLVDAKGSHRKTYARSSMALLLWVLAASLYQDYGIVLTGYLVYLFFRLAETDRHLQIREVLHLVSILASSVILYFSISMLLLWALASPERTPYLETNYLDRVGDISALLRSIVAIYFSDAVYGTQSLKFAAVGLLVLGALGGGSIWRRTGMLALGGAICVAPFVYGLGAMPPMRAASGLLFVVAGFCALAVAKSSVSIAFFVKCLVIFLALSNCIAITNISHYERLSWEADKMLAINLAQRIYVVAPDIHAEDRNVRILFVGSYQRKTALDLPGTQSWVGMFDTWGVNKVGRRKRAMNYAGFPDFRLASKEDYDAHQAMIESMSAWPDNGSVLRSGDVVIVKLGPANGYQWY